MSLRTAIEVVTKLADQGTIKQYAVAGAVAAINYIQPTLTEDLDILISIEDFEERSSGLILLAPIESALAKLGYIERSAAGIWIGDWPIQFLPVASPLDEEALLRAQEVEVASADGQPIKARILRAEHLVAIALKVGRLKDLARIEAFLDQNAVDLEALKAVLKRFDLMQAWKAFCFKAGRSDILE